MNAITLPVREKASDPVKAQVMPLNRSEETSFGLMDGLILGFILLVVAAGLVCLFLFS